MKFRKLWWHSILYLISIAFIWQGSDMYYFISCELWVLNSVVMFLASANSNGIVLSAVLFGKLQKVQLAAICETNMSTKALGDRVCYIFVVILTHRTHIFSQLSFTCDRCQDLHSDVAQTRVLFSWDYCKGKSVSVYAGKHCFSQLEEKIFFFQKTFFEKLLNKNTTCSWMRREISVASVSGFKFYWPCFVGGNKIVAFAVMIRSFWRKNY